MPENFIKKFDLNLVSQREIRLFTVSCLFGAYINFTKKVIGFSYNAIGYISFGSRVGTFLLNEKDFAKKVEKLLQNKGIREVNKVLGKADKLYFKAESVLNRKIEWVRQNPRIYLLQVIKFYPEYFAALNTYNAFWKFVGNDKDKLPAKILKNILIRRHQVSQLYPAVDLLIDGAMRAIDVKSKFFGDLLWQMTRLELKKYLAKNFISNRQRDELIARRRAYLYLAWENNSKSKIISQYKIVKKIYKNLTKFKQNESVVGFCSYPGLAKGRVYILPSIKSCPKSSFVIVANSTHPQYTSLIKKSCAIVADEGGILSHASVISREMKIPCIIGTKIATKLFKDDDMVEVDANKGIVRKI